jgi:hypothetical protein
MWRPGDEDLAEQDPHLYAKIRRYVEETTAGCWRWLGGHNGAGHPVMAWHGRAVAVRRLILNTLQPQAQQGAQTSLSCASPRCVRPDHIVTISQLNPDQAFAAFWSQVDRSGACWSWQGPYRADGRQVFYWAGKVHHPARWAYTFAYGPNSIPRNYRVVTTCAMASCLRLSHLAVLEYHTPARRARSRLAQARQDLPPELGVLETHIVTWNSECAPPLAAAGSLLRAAALGS